MISAISGSADLTTAAAGSVQQKFQVSAIKNQQQMLAAQVQTLLKGAEPGKGGTIDAYA
jgi:hypothetical protein